MNEKNNIEAKDLVQSKWAKLKIDFNRLTLKEKLSKLFTFIALILCVALLVFVVLIIVEYFSYDTTYGSLVGYKNAYSKAGQHIGYINEYVVAYGDSQRVVYSSQVVDQLYQNAIRVKLYVKESGNKLVVMENYKTYIGLLIPAISIGVAIAGLGIASIVLSRDKKPKEVKKKKVVVDRSTKGLGVSDSVGLWAEENIENLHSLDRDFVRAIALARANNADIDIVYLITIFMGKKLNVLDYKEALDNVIKDKVDILVDTLSTLEIIEGKEYNIYHKIIVAMRRETDIFEPIHIAYLEIGDKGKDLLEKARVYIKEKYIDAMDSIDIVDVDYDKFLKDLKLLLEEESLFREMFLKVNHIEEGTM